MRTIANQAMNLFTRFSVSLLVFLVLLRPVSGAEDKAEFDDSSLDFFEKEVRPILVSRCFECHSASKGVPKGGLALDSRDAVIKGGDTGPAVSLTKTDTSLLLSAINYGDVYQMPPKSKMPASEIAVLTKWVEMGLPWTKNAATTAGAVKPFDLASRVADHWCWQPVKKVSSPTVQGTDWPISSTDRFILAKLESKGLSPAPPADRRTLLRRVYFDLIGLPPSPEEVEEFANDKNPRAYESVVDRLLNSIHFGERWGRHWLDLVRYAETRGHEFEPIIPNAWQYRDYVIRALNADVPYDRFLTEHLAGDLMEPRWRESSGKSQGQSLPINEAILGTGFWFLGEEVHSPVDVRKDETDRIDNRLDVLSKTFLGLTVACARCHDHKFDAISQRDYYALAGFAISSSYRQIRVDTFEQHRRIANEVEKLRANSRREIAKSVLTATRPVLDSLDRYWVVAQTANNETAATAAAADSGQKSGDALTKIVDRLATENSLDARVLSRWCDELSLAKNDIHHPLHNLFSLKPLVAEAGSKHDQKNVVVDFGNAESSLQIQDGVSFGLKPVARGNLIVDGTPERPNFRVATIGGWQRDPFWSRITLAPGTEVDNGTLGGFQFSGRMVRTPEFTLTSRKLWYLVRGSVRVYAAVNSHLIIVGPLHGSLLREFKHDDDQWHWVSQDFDLYQGHRMHVEFTPFDNSVCTIGMVVQSDEAPAMPGPDWGLLDAAASGSTTIVQRVTAYQQTFREAAMSILEPVADSLAGTENPNATDVASHSKVEPPKAHSSSKAWIADWFLHHRNLFSPSDINVPNSNLVEAEKALSKQVQWESSLAPAIIDGNGVNEQLLVRGNSNTPKESVERRFLEAFIETNRAQNNQGNEDHGSGRLELAREILRSPLSSRVAVNRIWHHLFGRGIVPTVDNMGVLGLPPTHPELLDELAAQFVTDDWSMKSMIRSLVLSQTYQMSSHPNDADAIDPDNELWHRMLIKRLEGEVIRDSLLSVSGRLDSKSFGPSVPIHLTEFMQGRGRPGGSGPLDGNGRRSIYISVRRNFLSPMMLAFDTPSPFSTVGRRTVSNVPAQALILMNDPFVTEQARQWADRVIREPSLTLEQRLDRMYLTAFARHPSPAEVSEARAFLNSQDQSRPENQREAWGNLCHVMFNLKEFVFVD